MDLSTQGEITGWDPKKKSFFVEYKVWFQETGLNSRVLKENSDLTSIGQMLSITTGCSKFTGPKASTFVLVCSVLRNRFLSTVCFEHSISFWGLEVFWDTLQPFVWFRFYTFRVGTFKWFFFESFRTIFFKIPSIYIVDYPSPCSFHPISKAHLHLSRSSQVPLFWTCIKLFTQWTTKLRI